MTRFLAFGDSITEGFQPDPEAPAGTQPGLLPLVIPEQSYPARLQTMLADSYWPQSITVETSVVGGENTRDGLRRLPAVLDATRPDVLLLLEGENSLLAIGPRDVASQLRSMVRESQARSVKVLVAALTPVGPRHEEQRPGLQEAIEDLNYRITGLATDLAIGPAVDLFAAFGNDLSLLSADHLHPNQAGYMRIASTFFQAIVAKFEVVVRE